MAETPDIVDRADSFMQRRRRFVASRATTPAPAEDTEREASFPPPHESDINTENSPDFDEEDIPVLTEVILPNEAEPSDIDDAEDTDDTNENGGHQISPVPAVAEEGHTTPPPDEDAIAALASDIAQTIDQQLAYELPTLLEATLCKASEELRVGIASTIETAMRSYLAQRQAKAADDEQAD